MVMVTVTYKRVVRVEIDVMRPNGELETVDVSSKFHRMNATAFETIKKETAKAGRGDAIAYRNVEQDATYTKSEGDLMDDRYQRVIKAMRMGE